MIEPPDCDVPEGTWDKNDVPSFGELPTHALDADITLYWPWVRPCWEPTVDTD